VPGGRLLVGLVPLLLVPALGAVDGGFSPDAWVWSGTIAAWLAALAALGTGGSALGSAWPWAAAAGALCAWTIGSALWSSRQTQTVLEARRTVVYVAVVLALLLLARRGATRTLVIATHLALAGLVVYALAYYLFGGRNTDAFQA
jgi:predicted membrane channel-forming protein YqfA (hemolysin III family)